jgi:hypothetical protein
MAASGQRQRPKWTDVVTACATFVGGVALFFAAYQYYVSRQQWKIDIAIRAVFDGGTEIPYITQYCLLAGNDLEADGLKRVHNRERVPFASDAVAVSIGKCLADLKRKDRDEVYEQDNGRPIALTPRGAALLAQRINHALDKDEFIANLINQDVADKNILLQE